MDRDYPDLLSDKERELLLKKSELLFKDLMENQLGGYSDGNRPFFIMHVFKEVIEEYGRRDVGLKWSRDDLENHSKHDGDA